MDMAMDDFDGARNYLGIHRVHEMWEACVADLVLHKYQGKQKITDAIVDVVESADRKRSDPSKQIIPVVGLPESGFEAIVEEVVADCGSNVATHVKVSPHDTLRSVAIQIAGVRTDVVVVTGFPRTLVDAIHFEASTCHFHSCVAFANNDAIGEPTDAKAAQVQDKYLVAVNPVIAYFQAVDRGVLINVDDPKTNPASALKAVVTAAHKKHNNDA
eukprot:CAMPEP_0174850652 /NCGR_PEP_ID=MMETSP1114-20130205/20597_1 /TAXON_ID=312471 /ORGANISM="Neobodo designis, Strain CCAP 1951/1" /LENGTH=214 /DNA_ID=CAMNT_0016085125 /DNA_START=34 /DNA_END=678 /DNA_ORIENTATION=-